MPVVPQGYGYGGNGADGMFGGNWMWFLLIWFAMFGWGNNGFGGCNGGVGNEVQRGFSEAMSQQSGHWPMPPERFRY